MSSEKATVEKKNGRGGYKITLKRAKVAGILGLAVVLVAIFLMSPIFGIDSIEVNINNTARINEIKDKLGFKEGDNIFAINVKKAKSNIEKLERVDYCSIERDLSGNVVVTVSEKEEVGYIKISAGYAGIDESGKVMKISKEKEKTMPLINGIKIAEPQKNDYIKPEGRKAKQKTELLIRLLSSLKEHDLIERIATIDVENLRDVSMLLNTETLVLLGEDGTENEDRAEYKIAFLKAIIENPDVKKRPQNGGQLDLSNTDVVRSTP